MRKVYTDEFKKHVIEDYYSGQLGVRAIAQKYGLPSKNYITNWEAALKKKELIPHDASKPNKTAGRSKESIAYKSDLTQRERQYELEIEQLKAKVAYFESLDRMQPFLKKKKVSG